MHSAESGIIYLEIFDESATMNERNKVSLFIPKFKDHEVLNEEHLYQLARLPVDCFRLAIACRGRTGFFAPFALIRDEFFWNHIELETSGSLKIHNLFLISQNGFPFIVEGVKVLPNGDSTKTVLFVRATFPTCHASYKSDKGYGVDFFWGESFPSTDENSPVIELGRLVGNGDDRRFAFTPPAATLGSTKRLHDAGQSLRQAADDFCKVLAAHDRSKSLDCILLTDRIERLTLISDTTDLYGLVLEIRLLLKSLEDFLNSPSSPIKISVLEKSKNALSIAMGDQATTEGQLSLIKEVEILLRELMKKFSQYQKIDCTKKGQYDASNIEYTYELNNNLQIEIQLDPKVKSLRFWYKFDKEDLKELNIDQKNSTYMLDAAGKNILIILIPKKEAIPRVFAYSTK